MAKKKSTAQQSDQAIADAKSAAEQAPVVVSEESVLLEDKPDGTEVVQDSVTDASNVIEQAPAAILADAASLEDQPAEEQVSQVGAAEGIAVDLPKSAAMLDVLAVAAKTGSFRRCGMRFGKEPTLIDISALSDEQATALKNDPNLVVKQGLVPAEAVAEVAPNGVLHLS